MKKAAIIFLMVTILIIVASSCTWNRKNTSPSDRIPSENEPNKQSTDIENYAYLSPSINSREDKDRIPQRYNEVVYFLNSNGDELVPEERTFILSNENDLMESVILELISGPISEGNNPVINPEASIIDLKRMQNIVSVNLTQDFLNSADLRVARMALVNTLTEIEGIDYVELFVDGEELTVDGEEGDIFGLMSKYPNSIDTVTKLEEKDLNEGSVKKISHVLFFSDSHSQYLLPEIRKISVNNKEYAKAIIEELIKGPFKSGEGLYSVIPQGTCLLDVKPIIPNNNDDSPGIELYFTKEFKAQSIDSRTEFLMLSSLVHSLTGLPNVTWIKIYYQDEDGEFIDEPVYHFPLKKPLTKEKFPDTIGKRIKIYFSDKNAMKLMPEYRAVAAYEADIPSRLVEELILGPLDKANHVAIFPPGISIRDVKVWIDGDTAVVELPEKLEKIQLGSASEIATLYSIVNSLTDPVNTKYIKQVKFLVKGKKEETFGNMSLQDPFLRNVSIISE